MEGRGSVMVVGEEQAVEKKLPLGVDEFKEA